MSVYYSKTTQERKKSINKERVHTMGGKGEREEKNGANAEGGGKGHSIGRIEIGCWSL